MAYTKGYIHGNVDIRDLQRALRTSKCDIGKITTECAINQWAKYKPQDIGSQPDISEHERYLDRYGLNIPGLNVEAGSTPVEMLHHWLKQDSVAQRWWAYRRPGATDWHRYTDFNGYHRKAKPVNTDPNPEPMRNGSYVPHDINITEGEQAATVTFGLDYPVQSGSISWLDLLNPSNSTSGIGWHYMACIVPMATPNQIKSPQGGAQDLQSMWSSAIKLYDPEPISSQHKGGLIEWTAPSQQRNYTAILCLAQGAMSGGVFQPEGHYIPLYGNFFKPISVGLHYDARIEWLQVGWIQGGSAHWVSMDAAQTSGISVYTGDIMVRLRLHRGSARAVFRDVTARASSAIACNGETEVVGLLAVDANPIPQVSAPNQTKTVVIPATGSAESYQPQGRAWAETDSYADYVWMFEGLLPNIGALPVGGEQLSLQLGAQWGDEWVIFGSKSIRLNR